MCETVKPEPPVRVIPQAAIAGVGYGSPEQPYFVALISFHSGKASEGASIRDARTGEVTDLVKPPVEGSHFTRVTSLGTGVYVLVVSRPVTVEQESTSSSGADVQAYRLEVDTAGKARDLRPFSETLLPHGCRDIAGSPNGEMLAYAAADTRNRSLTSEVGLINLTNYSRHSVPLNVDGSISNFSWAGDSVTLAFEWHSASRSLASGIYVVDSHSDDWVSRGRVIVDQDQLGFDIISPVISADAQAIYVTIAEPEPTGGLQWTRLVRVPVGGGRRRTLFELRYQPNSYNLHYMWETVCRDRGDHHLLVFATGYMYCIGVSSGAALRLPFPEGLPYAAAW